MQSPTDHIRNAPLRAGNQQQTADKTNLATPEKRDPEAGADEKNTTHAERGVCASPSELEAAVLAAGEDPTQALSLAERLGIGLRPGAPREDAPVLQALRGAALPPPCNNLEWWLPIPAGAFDAGIARVMGAEDVACYEHFARANGLKVKPQDRNDVQRVREDIPFSYSFSRYVGILVSCFSDPEASAEEKLSQLQDLVAVAFTAGWYMGNEVADTAQYRRDAKAGAHQEGTVDELVSIMLTKIHYGAANVETWTSRDHWTPEQVNEALHRVRLIEQPEYAAEMGHGAAS